MRRFVIGFLALALVGCGEATATVAPVALATEIPVPSPTPTCQMLTQTYDDEMREVLTKWDDAKKIAASTSRMSLATPLATLQEIKRDTEALTVPACVQKTHDLLGVSMGYTIDGYLSFLRSDGDEIVNLQFQLADEMMTAYTGNVNKMVRGVSLPGQTAIPTP